MKVAQVIVKKIFGLFFGLIGFFKRLMCRVRGRGRKNSGNILPVVADHIVTASDIQQSVPSNDIELESWDSWGKEDQSGARLATIDPSTQNSTYRGQKQAEPEPEPDIDFFTGMAPEVKKNPKILIRKKETGNNVHSGSFSSRLAMTSDIPPADGELGTWEEGDNAWGAEAVEDLSWQAEAAIKEKRRNEREQRQQDVQRKRQEKDQQRQRKDSGFSAVKLS